MRYHRLRTLPLLLLLTLPWISNSPATPTEGAAARPVDSPPPSTRYPMSYDAGRNLTVLHTGLSTWEYGGASWQPVTTTHVPHLDAGAVMSYDQVRGLSVLAGLRDNYYQETWEYDGLDWTLVTPTVSYVPCVYGAMVADSSRGRLVFFGGMHCAKPGCAYFDFTYEYTGTTWGLVSTAHAPAPRASLGMAYDNARGVTVLFGGANNASGVLSDTWGYDGTDWKLISPTISPPARAAHAMVYDIARGRTVLFGGMAEGEAFGDTWEYDGATWYLTTPSVSPSPRSYPAMAYDAARGVVVLYGGDRPEGGAFNDTWEYDGTTWRLVTWYAVYLPCVSKP